MLLHIVAIIAVLFLIAVFFYKYSSSPTDFRLIQIEWDQADTWSELRTEGQPIIIRGAPTAASPVWTAVDLEERGLTLPAPVLLGTPAASAAAHQNFVDKWVRTWLPTAFHTSPVIRAVSPVKITAASGPQYIRNATAAWTVIAPTDKPCTVSIAMPSAAEFIPTTATNQYLPALTKADTPFIGDIKYIDVKLRPGTIIAIPCHWLYSIQEQEPANNPFLIVAEFHSPISFIASRLQ